MSKDNNNFSCRLGTVGGQAVIEGIMMKSGDNVALSVRDTNGKINTDISKHISIRTKNNFFNLPIIRGIVNFIESMILSTKTLNKSADMLGIEDEESKFEKWLTEKLGKSVATVFSVIGTVLGLALSVFLFMYLPSLISDFCDPTLTAPIQKSIIEGVVKILIFIAYIALVGLIPDMKRVFQYHGAEHKSIFCYESGLELTVENVMKQKRFHPRCGTSFLFVMMIIGILVSMFYITLPRLLRVLTKILILPLIVGIGYEFIRFAGKHDNIVTKILSAPGLWIQRLTTKEPDAEQIEVAIHSIKAALPDVFPPEQNTAEASTTDDKQNESQN